MGILLSLLLLSFEKVEEIKNKNDETVFKQINQSKSLTGELGRVEEFAFRDRLNMLYLLVEFDFSQYGEILVNQSPS